MDKTRGLNNPNKIEGKIKKESKRIKNPFFQTFIDSLRKKGKKERKKEVGKSTKHNNHKKRKPTRTRNIICGIQRR
jgi:hypothetical protein